MKLLVLYRPNSENARKTEEFIHDFVRMEPGRKVDLIDVDSPDGTAKATLYDVVEYPAILALDNDDKLLQSWSGELPLMNDLSYYAQTS